MKAGWSLAHCKAEDASKHWDYCRKCCCQVFVQSWAFSRILYKIVF